MGVADSVDTINDLFSLYRWIAIVIAILILGWLGWIMIRYRLKSG